MSQQAHDLQFVQRVSQGVVAFAVAAVSGKHPQHGLHTEAPTESAGGAIFSGGGEHGVILAIGSQSHDVEPIKIPKLGEVGAVEAGIVGEDVFHPVSGKPQGEIRQCFLAGAEDRLAAAVQKQGIGEHTACFIFGGDDMIPTCQQTESVAVGNDGADGHDLIVPVCFRIDDCKTHNVVPR